MRLKLAFPLILILLVATIEASGPKGFPWSRVKLADLPTNEAVSYQEMYYTQKVSHFNFRLSGQTWKQRYLIDQSFFSANAKGPIIMYCGNEGPIEMFYRNTGWYNDFVAKELKGLLVYPESRYFGKSWPFGDQKTSTSP